MTSEVRLLPLISLTFLLGLRAFLGLPLLPRLLRIPLFLDLLLLLGLVALALAHVHLVLDDSLLLLLGGHDDARVLRR